MFELRFAGNLSVTTETMLYTPMCRWMHEVKGRTSNELSCK